MCHECLAQSSIWTSFNGHLWSLSTMFTVQWSAASLFQCSVSPLAEIGPCSLGSTQGRLTMYNCCVWMRCSLWYVWWQKDSNMKASISESHQCVLSTRRPASTWVFLTSSRRVEASGGALRCGWRFAPNPFTTASLRCRSSKFVESWPEVSTSYKKLLTTTLPRAPG